VDVVSEVRKLTPPPNSWWLIYVSAVRRWSGHGLSQLQPRTEPPVARRKVVACKTPITNLMGSFWLFKGELAIGACDLSGTLANRGSRA
jgi:hypothetical protein